MSTLAYQALTKRRDEAVPGTSDDTKPGVGKYVDALAALIPAEVLAAHAVYLTIATDSKEGADGATTTMITKPDSLEIGFWILVVAAAALYLFPKIRKLEPWDAVRVFIPPLAFVAWTLIQTPSAFDPVNDALGLNWDIVNRQVIAVGAALFLGALATGMAYTADSNKTHVPDADLAAAGMSR